MRKWGIVALLYPKVRNFMSLMQNMNEDDTDTMGF